MEMDWTINLNYISGKKFCPMSKFQNCNIGFFPKKGLKALKKDIITWDECRDICNEKDSCDYFKWKVYSMNNTS